MVPIHPCVNRAKMLFSYIVVPYEGWNRTEFWTQNSRLYLDFIPKQKFLFSDSRLSNRWLYATNIRARLNKIWPKRKTFHSSSTICYSFEKKTQDFFYYFFRLHLHVRDFFQVWKISENWCSVRSLSVVQGISLHNLHVYTTVQRATSGPIGDGFWFSSLSRSW